MTSTVSINRYATIALIVLLSCAGLFWLDRETHSFADLVKRENWAAWIFYFVPTYALCALLFSFFENRNNKNSFALALIIGMPVGFAIVIVTLMYLMGRL